MPWLSDFPGEKESTILIGWTFCADYYRQARDRDHGVVARRFELFKDKRKDDVRSFGELSSYFHVNHIDIQTVLSSHSRSRYALRVVLLINRIISSIYPIIQLGMFRVVAGSKCLAIYFHFTPHTSIHFMYYYAACFQHNIIRAFLWYHTN